MFKINLLNLKIYNQSLILLGNFERWFSLDKFVEFINQQGEFNLRWRIKAWLMDLKIEIAEFRHGSIRKISYCLSKGIYINKKDLYILTKEKKWFLRFKSIQTFLIIINTVKEIVWISPGWKCANISAG